MLVLTRKIGEIIVIGDDIKIKVVDIKGRQVRIGIEAPKHIAVNREEIHRQKNGEQALESLEIVESEAPKTGTYDK